MSALYKTSALVLNSTDYGESDRIVNFYTMDYGKICGIAKGAKRSKKRFVNSLESFSFVKLIFAKKQGAGLARIDQCELIDGFHNIKKDLETITAASYFVELLSEMVREWQRNTKAFELILNFLRMLDDGREPETFSRFFEVKLLTILGYQPHLDKCTVCKYAPDADTIIYFSSAKGGIVCKRCIKPNENKIPISAGTAKSLALAARTNLEHLNKLVLPPLVLKESKELLGNFIRYQLGKELKSMKFMETIG